MHHHRINRRNFLRTTSATLLTAPFIASGWLRSAPNTRVRHASFGANGMALADITSLTSHESLDLVAVADVDLARTDEVRKRFPKARIYQDWRELLDKEKELDSVNVSTPDHMHAPIAMSALQLGRHVYCQKPLTHDIYESRRVTEVARERGLVSQMGIQIHSGTEYRTAVQRIQELRIGKITEVHTWSGKKWGDTEPMPKRTDPVPAGLNWDLWLGICQERPFIGEGWYHPGNWRKRLDFGTGTFGDMGCHIYDPVFKALALTAPLVQTATSATDPGRAEAARKELAAIGARGVKPLLDALSDEREAQQRIAVEVLAHVANPAAGPTLFNFATGQADRALRLHRLHARRDLRSEPPPDHVRLQRRAGLVVDLAAHGSARPAQSGGERPGLRAAAA
ncbi:MAG: Glucose--fructose oxidoreductase precursor, partial [Verrucomicrobiota bacterium]